MKMINSTIMTSAIGVTLICAIRPFALLPCIAISGSRGAL
jgi:hypothetical protein